MQRELGPFDIYPVTKGQGGKIDLLLTATAIENDAVLVTHDGDRLDGAISGLQVEDWY